MRSLSRLSLAVVGLLAGCVSNTITLETDGDDGPMGSTSTTGSPVTVGTSAAVTTTPPPQPPPPPPPATSAVTTDEPRFPDFGSMDTTDGRECDPPCEPGFVCVAGECFGDPDFTTGDACGFEGEWLNCFTEDGGVDDALCGDPESVCLSDAPPMPGLAVCSHTGCVDACDCPLAPADGDAVVGCEDLTGRGIGHCFLNCSEGAVCPEGMYCEFDFICVYPSPL